MSRSKKSRKQRRRRANSASQNPVTNKQQIKEALKWAHDENIFNNLARHGNTKWLPDDLIALTLLWMWSPASALTDAFDDAKTYSQQIFGRVALSTYQGLAGALQTWTPIYMPLLKLRLHTLMKKIGGRHYRIGRWVPIAFDGSRATTPRTESNEKAFCSKTYGKSKTAKYRKKKNKAKKTRCRKKTKSQPQGPQIWITLLWHMGMGLPWDWKLGPSTASERGHVMEMVGTGIFDKLTLFVGDAGFVGYDFWKQIIDQGHHFLVRVGANVTLLQSLSTLPGLGYRIEKKKGFVYCWPKGAMAKKLPPLKLRLVKCKVGKKWMYLLTSVLDSELLNQEQIAELYKQRWGVEVAFRGLKQTFGRRKIRSRRSDRALVEMEWSIFAMALVQLFALREQLPQPKSNPHKASFSRTIRAVRRSLSRMAGVPEEEATLHELLREATKDEYQRTRKKAARYNPQKKDKPSCGQPKVKRATAEQRKKYKQVELKNSA